MEKVFLANAPKYDPGQISATVSEAAKALDVSLSRESAILLADCPWAHPKFAPHAHTHLDFIAGVADAIRCPITVAGNSQTGFPTRYSFRQAGYGTVASRSKIRLLPLDEAAAEKVTVKDGKVLSEARLPSAWLHSGFRVLMPKLRQSTLVPFAGALRLMQSLLPQKDQLKDSHRLPEKMIDLVGSAPVDLIVVDAIQALDCGGEVSGQPVDLGVIVAGTNPVAVDLVCAIALGIEPGKVDFLNEAQARGLGPKDLKEIQIVGDLSLDELRRRAKKVELADPNPATFPLPPQVRVVRSEKARQPGVSGVLADMFYILKNAEVSMKSSPLTTIVIGAVKEIPPGKDEYSTIIFMDDTSTGEYSNYGRIVRLPGRNIALSQVLRDVPYAIKAMNLQGQLGTDFMLDQLVANLAKLFPQK